MAYFDQQIQNVSNVLCKQTWYLDYFWRFDKILNLITQAQYKDRKIKKVLNFSCLPE